MTGWQDHSAGNSLDDRGSYVGTTLVYPDRYGPSEFWRRGVQVPCICDEAAGIACTYHGRQAAASTEETAPETDIQGDEPA
jgi:hypothetical protein